ncbi:MAG: D-alanyl-D-alanine carboxypeptidase family protein [Oscillospiraceae bacterium]|nr:D-alanyl-D-alanine carboxypeptidase family protein [Oscillospiraceae bacterium]
MARRRKIRWDRLAVAAVLLIVLIFLFGSCVQSCSDDDGKKSRSAQTTGESSQEGSDTTGGSAPSSSSATSTSASMVNLPVVVTEKNPAESVPIMTELTTTTAVSDGPAIPENYQAVSLSEDAVHRGTLILVDKSHPCTLSKEELDLEQVSRSVDKPDTYEVSYPGHTSLNRTAIAKFNRLMKAYFNATNNREIMFNYGWLEDGKEKSNPESATALDIQLHIKRADGGYEYVTNKAPYSWLFDHMSSYGFILRYPEDKTEFTGISGGYTAIRYVGVPHADYMKEHGYCLEEYLDTLKKNYTFGQGMLEYSTPELTYHIYYFPASKTGTTELPVPKTGSYEISGNNTDGFIVTTIIS